jgi:hypothetical protein
MVVLALNPGSDWGRARLRELGPSWSSEERLVDLVAEVTGGKVELGHALLIERDRITLEASPERAALMVLASIMQTNKSVGRTSPDR